jgi:hypothetical protein
MRKIYELICEALSVNAYVSFFRLFPALICLITKSSASSYELKRIRVVLQFIPVYESTIYILSYQLKLLLFIAHLHIEVSLLLLKIYNLYMDIRKLFLKPEFTHKVKCVLGG